MIRRGICFPFMLLPFAILIAGFFYWREQIRQPDTSFWPREAPKIATAAAPTAEPIKDERSPASIPAE